MTLKQAIKVLSYHQRWQIGDNRINPTIPSKLSEALAIAINTMSKIDTESLLTKKVEINEIRKD